MRERRVTPADGRLEIEDKYDVGDDFVLPDLSTVKGVATVAPPEELPLTATYFDTPDLRLAAARVTLRSRTGGVDDGWHLKLPAAGARTEVHRPLGRSDRRVPAALQHEVRVHLRDGRLGPVARLITHRTVYALLDADGGRLAEVTDDRVTGEALGGGAVELTRWREVEVELVAGRSGLLKAVGKVLRGAGAVPAASASKLARTLGDRVPTRARATLDPDSAGGVVLRYLAEQVDEIARYDPRVREDAPDAVHKMRVATRRMRSALRAFRPLLDAEVAEPLRVELAWLAGLLGGPRDAEVMQLRLRTLAGEQPPELLLGPVTARIERELRGTHRTAHRELRAALSGERYYRLLDGLDDLLRDPPLLPVAAGPADTVLPPLVRRSWRRVARAAGSEQPDAEHLHEVRKAAKRARYAAEVAIPVGGPAAVGFARAMRSVQSVLGDHHDAAVAAGLLREMGVRAHLAGENGFSYGRLHALEQQAEARYGEQFAHSWPDAAAKKHRRWLRV